MRTIMIALACLAITTAATAAEHAHRNEEDRGFVVLRTTNGHWECHCWCNAESGGERTAAEIPGKCDDDTNGSMCSFTDYYGEKTYGTLGDCESIFIIDDDDR